MRFLLLPLILFGLNGAPATAGEATLGDGQALFETFCASCHGPDGRGDGPAAAGLDTRPADLTKIAERRDGVWPILEIMSILDGYTKRVAAREEMPIIGELGEGPMLEFDTGNGLVTSVPVRLLSLAQYLESIQSPPPDRYVP